jgi:hypothetical protein
LVERVARRWTDSQAELSQGTALEKYERPWDELNDMARASRKASVVFFLDVLGYWDLFFAARRVVDVLSDGSHGYAGLISAVYGLAEVLRRQEE